MPPKLEPQPGGAVILTWPDYRIQTTINHFRQGRDGIRAEVTVASLIPGSEGHLREAEMNLMSLSVRKAWAKDLAELVPATDWHTITEDLCNYAVHYYREGEPVEELWSHEDVPPASFLVHPLLVENDINLIYGDGQTGKSQTALLLYLCSLLPWLDNPMHFSVPTLPAPGLYLDYEASKRGIHRTFKDLVEGHGLASMPLIYRRLSVPLADSFESTERLIKARKIKFIIVDSLTGAVGGDLNDPKIVNPFFSAIRSIDVTWLLIHHISKEARGQRHKSPMGSVIFWNRSRSIWLTKVVDRSATDLTVTLSHEKYNHIPYQPPFALHFSYGAGIKVERLSAQRVPEAMETAPLGIRIIAILRKGPMAPKTLSEELGERESNIKMALKRLKDKGQVVNPSHGMWGVVAQEYANGEE